MSDNQPALQERIQEALDFDEYDNADYVVTVLSDVLTEVAKLNCQELADYHESEYEGLSPLPLSKPHPCGTCIVCISRQWKEK